MAQVKKRTLTNKKTSPAKPVKKAMPDLPTRPATCRECPEWKEMRRKLRISELLLQAIDGFESRLKAKNFKPTVTEYLKLLQMEHEIDAQEEGPQEIKVTWVDPTHASESEK